jgi:predicted methyltransferase
MRFSTSWLAALLAASACATAHQEVRPVSPLSIVDAPDRSPEDRALDPGRHPVEMLNFLALTEGMRVAELGAGRGYSTELLARAVGPSGVVYAQNSPSMLKRIGETPWADRLKKPVMANVVRLDRDFDDPLPADVRDLDAVIFLFIYHDTVWMKTDRDRMNHAVYNALKPGGIYVVADHSSRVGAGAGDAETFHRIDQATLEQEVEKAGFRLVGEADFLRNPNDARDWNDSPRAAGDRRGTSDRFILRFIKPVKPDEQP